MFAENALDERLVWYGFCEWDFHNTWDIMCIHSIVIYILCFFCATNREMIPAIHGDIVEIEVLTYYLRRRCIHVICVHPYWEYTHQKWREGLIPGPSLPKHIQFYWLSQSFFLGIQDWHSKSVASRKKIIPLFVNFEDWTQFVTQITCITCRLVC